MSGNKEMERHAVHNLWSELDVWSLRRLEFLNLEFDRNTCLVRDWRIQLCGVDNQAARVPELSLKHWRRRRCRRWSPDDLGLIHEDVVQVVLLEEALHVIIKERWNGVHVLRVRHREHIIDVAVRVDEKSFNLLIVQVIIEREW